MGAQWWRRIRTALIVCLGAGPVVGMAQTLNEAHTAAMEPVVHAMLTGATAVDASVPITAGVPPAVRASPWPDRRCTLSDRHFIGINALAADPPSNYTFLHGGFRFETRQCALGGMLTIQMQHPQPLPAGAVLLTYGRPRDSEPVQWYEYPAIISGNMVTYVVADGGAGDGDGEDVPYSRAMAPVAIALTVQNTPSSFSWTFVIVVLAGLCGLAAWLRSNAPTPRR